jgi:hypothetical protein
LERNIKKTKKEIVECFTLATGCLRNMSTSKLPSRRKEIKKNRCSEERKWQKQP